MSGKSGKEILNECSFPSTYEIIRSWAIGIKQQVTLILHWGVIMSLQRQREEHDDLKWWKTMHERYGNMTFLFDSWINLLNNLFIRSDV